MYLNGVIGGLVDGSGNLLGEIFLQLVHQFLATCVSGVPTALAVFATGEFMPHEAFDTYVILDLGPLCCLSVGGEFSLVCYG